jgi:UDP-3-O-[3-hydroxymyristoyl] N-acetylglucosamine deacetylase
VSDTEVAGRGLHSGAHGSVRFVHHPGPVVVRAGGVDTPVTELDVVDTTRSTTVAAARGAVRIGTVEHVFAALGGLGVHRDVAVVLEGREAPLADGAARLYVDALRALGAIASSAPLVVVRDGSIEVGASRYELRRGEAIELEVAVDFDDDRIAKTARWGGDPGDFVARIAGARTFGFEHEMVDLLARGLASHVTPESVVVIGEGRILSSGPPFLADEPARHKLLDLIGDLYLYGGPPRGGLRAVRPGHAATHEVMRRALEEGLVAPA